MSKVATYDKEAKALYVYFRDKVFDSRTHHIITTHDDHLNVNWDDLARRSQTRSASLPPQPYGIEILDVELKDTIDTKTD